MTSTTNGSHDLEYVSNPNGAPYWKCKNCDRFVQVNSPYSSWEECPHTKGDKR